MSRILLDENLPFGLMRLLAGHDVRHAIQEGWASLSNGRLLAVAEAAGFEVLITADRNLRHQQNMAGRSISVLVLSTNYWPLVRQRADEVARAVWRLLPGTVAELDLGRP